MYERSLAIIKSVYGPRHPHVAVSLNNLARHYSAQGRYLEAEPVFRRSLKIAEETLGPDHPIVAAILSSLAQLLRKTDRVDQADRMDERAQAILAKPRQGNTTAQ